MDSGGQDELVVRRWRKNTLREVYFRDNNTVVKRYWVRPGAPRRHQRPWKNEHEALARLAGLGVPETLGYTQRPHEGGVEVIFTRGFVPGKHIDAVSDEDVKSIAALIATFHLHGVVTDDAALQNFVKNDSGELHFIDFGRAIVLRKRTLRFYYYVGHELAKLSWWTLLNNEAKFELLCSDYFSICAYPAYMKYLIVGSYHYSCFVRWCRKGSAVGRLFGKGSGQDGKYPGLRYGKYSKGDFIVNGRAADPAVLEQYVTRLGFLNPEEETRIPTHNKRYRVYGFRIPELTRDVIMKISWQNPAYSFGRRFNIAVSQFLRDYGRRGFFGALKLQASGIESVRPLACWKFRKSFFNTESYLLYERIPAVATLKQFLENQGSDPGSLEIRSRLLGKMAGLIKAIADAALRHGDVALGNFLVLAPGDGEGDEAGASSCELAVIDTDNITSTLVKMDVVKRFFDLSMLKRLNLPEGERMRVVKGLLGDAYSSSSWTVAEFWRRGGNRPFKTLLRVLSGKGLKP
jgi:hypothetical protein